MFGEFSPKLRTFVGGGFNTANVNLGSGNMPPPRVGTLVLVPASPLSAALIVQATFNQSQNLAEWRNPAGGTVVRIDNTLNVFINAALNVTGATGLIANSGATALAVTSGSTNTNTPYVGSTWTAVANGTPAAGFGTSHVYSSQSSTNTPRLQSRTTSVWATATDGAQLGRYTIQAADSSTTATTNWREGIRVESDGTQPLLGFYGGAAAAKPTSGDLLAAAKAVGLVGSGVTSGAAAEAPVVPPVLANFGWLNQGTDATATATAGGGIWLTSPGQGGINFRVLQQTTTGHFTAIMRVTPQAKQVGSGWPALGVRDPVTDKYLLVAFIMVSSLLGVYVNTGTGVNYTSSSGKTNFNVSDLSGYRWWKIVYDGTNVIFSAGPDGYSWAFVWSEPASTIGTPTQAVVLTNPNSTTATDTYPILLTSFQITNP